MINETAISSENDGTQTRTLSSRIPLALYKRLKHACTDRNITTQAANIESLVAWIEQRIIPVLDEDKLQKSHLSPQGEKAYTFTASQWEREIMRRVGLILRDGPKPARAAIIAVLDLVGTIAEKHIGDPDPVSELLAHTRAIENLAAKQLGESPKKAAGNPPVKASTAKPRKTSGERTA